MIFRVHFSRRNQTVKVIRWATSVLLLFVNEKTPNEKIYQEQKRREFRARMLILFGIKQRRFLRAVKNSVWSSLRLSDIPGIGESCERRLKISGMRTITALLQKYMESYTDFEHLLLDCGCNLKRVTHAMSNLHQSVVSNQYQYHFSVLAVIPGIDVEGLDKLAALGIRTTSDLLEFRSKHANFSDALIKFGFEPFNAQLVSSSLGKVQ